MELEAPHKKALDVHTAHAIRQPPRPDTFKHLARVVHVMSGPSVTMESDILDKIHAPVDLSQMNREIYFLIARFLSDGPMARTAQTLMEEMEANEVIPKRTNWLGEEVKQDFKQYSGALQHVRPDHLPQLLKQLLLTVEKRENVKAATSKSLLSTNILRSHLPDSPERPPRLATLMSRKPGHPLIRQWGRGNPINAVHEVMSREMKGSSIGSERISANFYENRIKLSSRSVGHLTAVYCVLYDNTGRYIFTGADDKLVKVWSAVNGRLLVTLRGAVGEITDMAVNPENTLLAVGSNDKLIRVWSLHNCSCRAVLPHGGQITSVYFCPMPISSKNPVRYLASTATDGSVAFWAYEEKPGEDAVFQPKPTLYQERMRPGHAQILCASFSTGGVFMAAGSADNNVRVYYMLNPEGPLRILEVECHQDRVDSISWAHHGVRFISGSKDGTALVYRYERQQWRYTRINCAKSLPGEAPVVIEDPKKRPKPTMVAWNRDDSLVLTATSDFLIKCWNPSNGTLIRVLKGHSDEMYVIESHPIHSNIICTAGHDGRIIMWDIGTLQKDSKSSQDQQQPQQQQEDSNYGRILFQHQNLIQGHGHGSIFDCKLSPNGLGFVATDSHGHILIFGMNGGPESKFAKLPNELFFHTDYRPFLAFGAGNPDVIDEQTQTPTHLMPPPFLVDAEGNPYPADVQRLVPGRETCKVEQLVPEVAVAPGGNREVVAGNRSNIDQMIEQLAARNAPGPRDEFLDQPAGGGNDAQPQQRLAAATWQPGGFPGIKKKIIVPPLAPGVLSVSERERQVAGDEEEEYYQKHLKIVPMESNIQPHPLLSPTFSPSGRRPIRRPRRNEPVYFRPVEHHDEHNILDEVEGVARPNPPQQEISIPQESPRRATGAQGRLQRSTATSSAAAASAARAAASGAAATNRRTRRVRYNVRRLIRENGGGEDDPDAVDHIPSPSESESEESMDGLEDTSSSSDSGESSESDWGSGGRDQDGNGGARKKAKRAARNRSSSPTRQATGTGTTGKKKRVKREKKSDDTDDTSGEPRAGPSSACVDTPPSADTKTKPKKKRVVAEVGGLDEIQESFRPAEWFSEVMPKRSPYFPQLGDELVYFRQGHELYVRQVENLNIYQMDKKMQKSLPYVQDPDLPPEISVRVVHIAFELQPPRLVNLKLERVDWNTGLHTGNSFNVRYHDLPSIADFLVLRQIYDKSVRHQWHADDRFRCMMDKTWWLGTVLAKQPYDSKYENSNFQCYSIIWDGEDQEPEQLSPWDMEIIPDDFVVPEDSKDGVPATDEEVRSSLYEVRPEDWEPHGHQDAECRRISTLVEGVMNLAIAEAFLTPVDLNAWPEYAYEIAYPMDLSTIKARLDNLFYRRAPAILTDVERIGMNAAKFNEPNSDIVKHARVVTKLLQEIVENEDFGNVSEAYHRLMASVSEETSAVAPTSPKKLKVRRPNTDRSSPSGDSGGSTAGPSRIVTRKTVSTRNLRTRMARSSTTARSSRVSSSDDSCRPWKQRCKELLSLVWNQSDAVHFRHPVNLADYPDYDQVIDTPMSLQSIREDLAGDNYETPMDFHKDMMLIFENSRTYNTDPRSQIRLMTIRLKSFYEEKYKRILEDWKRNKRRHTNRTLESSSMQTTPSKSLRSTRSNFSTPTKSAPAASTSSPRAMPLRASSSSTNLPNAGQSSPRKYPQREAAAKNPYVHARSQFSERKVSKLRKTARFSRSGSKKLNVKRLRKKAVMNGTRNKSRNDSRNRRASSNVSSTSSSHHEPMPTSTARLLRKRRRISSGESNTTTDAGPATLTNGKSSSPPQLNGRSPKAKVFIKDNNESNDEHEGRYNFRNKGKGGSSHESSSPERNTGHNLRARTNVRRIVEDSDEEEDEEEEEIERRNGGPTDDEEEKENAGVAEDEDEEEEEVPRNQEEDEEEEDDVQMPVLKEENDEDYQEDEDEEEDDGGSEFEGEESTPTPTSTTSQGSNLRRSSRANKVKRRIFDEDDEGSDCSVGRSAKRVGGSKRVTRNRGRSAANYVEDDESDLD